MEGKEGYADLLKKLHPLSQKKKIGAYYKYTYNDPSGAQVFIYSKAGFFKKEEFFCAFPGFEGKGIQKIWSAEEPGLDGYEYGARIINEEKCEVEGTLSCWVHNEKDEEYPLLIDIQNYLETMEKKTSEIKRVQITLFPHQFEHYKTEQDFRKKYPKGEKNPFPSPGMFIPSGTFSPKNYPNFKPHAECYCYGRVEFAETLKNEFSGLEFQHVIIDTYGAKYDVLVDWTHKQDIEIGDIVGGFFWVSGKVLFE